MHNTVKLIEPLRPAPAAHCAVLLALVGLALTASAAAPQTALVPTEVYLREIVGYLAGPDCAGRRVGTAGIELAAEYLEGQLGILGVAPLPGLAGYRQEFPVTRGIRPAGDPLMLFHDAETQHEPEYVLAPFCGSGSFTDAQVVFAGYGISAPELGWDDYASLDVSGKVVAIVRGEPTLSGADSKFTGEQPTVHSDLRRKAAAAKAKGAQALLVMENPLTAPDSQADELPEIHPAWGGGSSDLPVLHVKRALLAAVFAQAQGHPLTAVLAAMNSHAMPASTALEAWLSLDLTVVKEQLPAWNLVGLIPGSGPLADEYIVVGAHYDHLGEGGPESLAPNDFGSIHWGADDNASGCAVVLALARELSLRPEPLQRSVLLVFFSAEEIGLVGSNWLVDNPPVPLEQIHSMLNFDMVGRLRDNQLELGGSGTASEFAGLLDQLDPHGIKLLRQESGSGGSDHMSFISKSIPALFFITGSHGDYHTPRDTADLINYEGLARVAGLGTDVCSALANHSSALSFVKPTAPSTPARSRAGLSVTMGTIPSYIESAQPGFTLGDVVPGGPAAQAGLQAGDVIIRIGELAVANIYDFMYALQSRQPGDVVEVRVLRAGAELQFMVTLAARGVEQ